mmetsp:Transcript_95936/g.175709  ORF Transcript_95936/g.175709 Transcript_95936/m.175709 type:complete len:82 (-) Transcript_95936:71-316(-)
MLPFSEAAVPEGSLKLCHAGEEKATMMAKLALAASSPAYVVVEMPTICQRAPDLAGVARWTPLPPAWSLQPWSARLLTVQT